MNHRTVRSRLAATSTSSSTAWPAAGAYITSAPSIPVVSASPNAKTTRPCALASGATAIGEQAPAICQDCCPPQQPS